MAHGVLIGIDFGTFNTAAMVRRGDGDARPLLFDGSPLLPSAVLLEGPGDILSGADAVRSARLYPDRFEPNPKRRMADGIVLLGGHETDVVDLVAAVLGRVADEARQVTGQVPDHVVVTHPEIWGTSRLSRLAEAVRRAGLPTPKLVSEPVAAAAYFLAQVGRVGTGQCAVVYDFGAGTFDASVVRRRPDGALTVLASEGLPEVGGLDLDAALVEHLGQLISQRGREAWDRLRRPASAADRRASWQLWEDVRLAKESLSRRPQTLIHLPFLDDSVPISREEFEHLARPVIERTVAVTRAAVRSAGIGALDVGGIFLVGGSSRVPLVATLLHRAFDIPPTVLEQPELVVAEGSLNLLDAREERTPAGVTMTLPAQDPDSNPDPTPDSESPTRPLPARGTAPPVVAPAPAVSAPPPVDPPPTGRREHSTASQPPTAAGSHEPPGRRERPTPTERPGRQGVGRHLADPLGAGAAVVLGILAAVVANSAGATATTAALAGVVVAALVYVVRVVLGILFDR